MTWELMKLARAVHLIFPTTFKGENMKKAFILTLAILSLNVFAEQVETECPWSHDSESREVKQIISDSQSASSQSSSESSAQ
jgi:hypothetical protein